MGRMHFIDNIRILLIILVIMHHTAIAYGAAGGWYYIEGGDEITSIALTLFTAINQAYFMGFFFFISGYFTPASFDKKGPSRFMKDRLIRLGIPLLVYVALIGPALVYFVEFRNAMPFAEFYAQNVLTFKVVNWGPLWFVEALLYFAAGYALWRLVFKKTGGSRPFPSHKILLLAAIGIGVAAFLVRLVFPVGESVLGLQFGYFPSYIFLFIAGIMAKRNDWIAMLTGPVANRWFLVSVMSILLLPVVLIGGGALEGSTDVFMGGFTVQSLAYAVWEPFVAIGIILKLLDWCRTYANKTNPLIGKLSESAFTAFIIHAPVVVLLSVWLSGAELPAIVKFLTVSSVGTLIIFFISSLIIKLPYAKKVL